MEDFLDYVDGENGSGIVYFRPDLYTNLMDVNDNRVSLDKLRRSEIVFNCKVVCERDVEKRVGEKLCIVNNVKYGLGRINLKVMNFDESIILQELEFYGEGDIIELEWNGKEYILS